ncbi:hypothetical protein [Streptomyces chilikensis]|uniref:Uncharacterized protein n=1 Tax=Streptomyces chilikensis TaxID=1194079 RepID=A0ABV3ERI3_9ACTN
MQDRSESTSESVVRTPDRVLASFPAGHPRGDLPAEESARQHTANGTPATVVMDIQRDEFLVVRWAA